MGSTVPFAEVQQFSSARWCGQATAPCPQRPTGLSTIALPSAAPASADSMSRRRAAPHGRKSKKFFGAMRDIGQASLSLSRHRSLNYLNYLDMPWPLSVCLLPSPFALCLLPLLPFACCPLPCAFCFWLFPFSFWLDGVGRPLSPAPKGPHPHAPSSAPLHRAALGGGPVTLA